MGVEGAARPLEVSVGFRTGSLGSLGFREALMFEQLIRFTTIDGNRASLKLSSSDRHRKSGSTPAPLPLQ